MMDSLQQPLAELLRPRQLDDLTLPQRDIDRLQRMVDAGQIMSMVFCGGPGLGKTSAARIITHAVAGDSGMEINGSVLTGIDSVRERIEPFARSGSLFGGQKICLIDEADYLSKHAQASLRYIIENSWSTCRFLFTVNDIGKLTPAIQSRLTLVCFDIVPPDRDQVLQQLRARYRAKLAELGVKHDEARLDQIIGLYFGDLRKIAQQVEWELLDNSARAGLRPENPAHKGGNS
jgi:replication-associated recombination protein RarA